MIHSRCFATLVVLLLYLWPSFGNAKAGDFGIDLLCETSTSDVLIDDVCFIRVKVVNRDERKFIDHGNSVQSAIGVRIHNFFTDHFSPSLVVKSPPRAAKRPLVIPPGGSAQIVAMFRVIENIAKDPGNPGFRVTYRFRVRQALGDIEGDSIATRIIGNDLQLNVVGGVQTRESQITKRQLRLHRYEFDSESLRGNFNESPALFSNEALAKGQWFPIPESEVKWVQLLPDLREDSAVSRLIRISQRYHELIRADNRSEDHGALLYKQLLRSPEIERQWLVKQLYLDLDRRQLSAAAATLKQQATQEGIWRCETIQ